MPNYVGRGLDRGDEALKHHSSFAVGGVQERDGVTCEGSKLQVLGTVQMARTQSARVMETDSIFKLSAGSSFRSASAHSIGPEGNES